MNKFIIAVIVLGITVPVGYFLLRSSSPSASVSNIPLQSSPQAMLSEESTASTTETRVTEETLPAEPSIVVYNDEGYSPNILHVKVGTTITFKNESTMSVWTASAVHPTHRAYPTTGGCLGSTFDTCKGIQPGASWPFKFDLLGTWKYHDHLHPGAIGSIIVE